MLKSQFNSDLHGSRENYTFHEEIDSRGNLKASTSLVIAIGRTFKSGYLNMPVNVYVQPRKDGVTAGFSIGFNLAKKPKL